MKTKVKEILKFGLGLDNDGCDEDSCFNVVIKYLKKNRQFLVDYLLLTLELLLQAGSSELIITVEY